MAVWVRSFSDLKGYCSWTLATYDESGYNNYTDVFDNSVDNFDLATVVAGTGCCLPYIEYRLIVAN